MSGPPCKSRGHVGAPHIEKEHAMAEWTAPTQSRVEGYFKELNNWGRWGRDDQRGTANLITPAKRAQAQQLVRSGRTVSLARDIGPQPAILYHVTSASPRQ